MQATRRIPLDDRTGHIWSVREALGDTWQWYVIANPPAAMNSTADAAAAARTTRGWIPAYVPGSITADLQRAGIVPDPLHSTNSRASEWAAERSWILRRRLDLSETDTQSPLALELDGVDPGAYLHFDGHELGYVEGIHRRHLIPIPSHLAHAGAHWLTITLPPAARLQPQVGRTSRVRLLAPRMTMGWDFCPRQPHQGVWRSIRLVSGSVRLDNLQVRSTTSNPQQGDPRPDGRVTTCFDLVCPRPIQVEMECHGTRITALLEQGRHELTMNIPSPARWLPHGMTHATASEITKSVSEDAARMAALYEVTIRARDPQDGEILDTVQRNVGFRCITLSPNPGGSQDARGYTLTVDGLPIVGRGWNWVPSTFQYGEENPEAVEHMLQLAAASGANLIRVWGGGLLESEHFYDICDRLGLLVWQEFSQSSSGIDSHPATDDEFLTYVQHEAEEIIPQRSHHPSLALWCGGNELQGPDAPLHDDTSPALSLLHECLSRLDPDRAWLPTSPSGPCFGSTLADIERSPDDQHDVHGPWEFQGLVKQYTLYNHATSLAHTEFGVEGMAHMSTLESLIDPADRWPADRSNLIYRHLGEWWVNTDMLHECFGRSLASLERQQRASQFLQSEGLGYAVDADLRRSPRLSMVIPWQLGESFPNASCTAVTDYWGRTKPAFHAVARAFRSNRVSLRVERLSWAGQDALHARAWVRSATPCQGEVHLKTLSVSGDAIAENILPVPAGTHPRDVGEIRVARRDIPGEFLIWRADWYCGDTLVDTAMNLATISPDLSGLFELKRAEVEIEVLPDAHSDKATIALRHRHGPAIIGLRVIDDGPLHQGRRPIFTVDSDILLPHETLTIAMHNVGDGARVIIDAFNLDPQVVEVAP